MKLTDKIEVLNEDCMEVMSRYPDKYFDLAVVDPPYGIDIGNASQGMWATSKMERKDWDKSKPSFDYWSNLFRVSKNQIVSGGNYFGLPISRGWIIWDKGEGFKGRDFAECEMIWTSFDCNTRIFKRDPLANGDYRGKIHPTQKPVALYDWIFKNYAETWMKILDTYGGSMSSVISADKAGLEMVCCELDKDYFDNAVERFKRYKSQEVMQFK